MYLITTGMPHSQTRRDLSSDEVTNLLLLSMKVIVLTAPKCWSYLSGNQNLFLLKDVEVF